MTTELKIKELIASLPEEMQALLLKYLPAIQGLAVNELIALAKQIIEEFKDAEPADWESDQSGTQDLPPTPFDNDVPF